MKNFPLWALLILYEKSHSRDTYVDYFCGLTLLIEWLGPIEIPITQHKEYKPIPKLLRTFELSEISKLVKADITIVYQEYLQLYVFGEEEPKDGY